MAQKTVCDLCKRNEADKNFKIMEKYQIWGPFYGDDWRHIDVCTECYKKLFGDTTDEVNGDNNDLMEYKERVLNYFKKIVPMLTIYTANDRFYFMKLVNDILNERYDEIEHELSTYNRIKDMKESNKLC